MNFDGQIEVAESVDWSGRGERYSRVVSQPLRHAQVVEQLYAIWDRLGTVASEPDPAVQRALKRIRHEVVDKAQTLTIGCEALAAYDKGATLGFAELAHLTAIAAGEHRADELPSVLRQAARRALDTCWRAELDWKSRELIARRLRQIEGEQIAA